MGLLLGLLLHSTDSEEFGGKAALEVCRWNRKHDGWSVSLTDSPGWIPLVVRAPRSTRCLRTRLELQTF